MDKVNYSVQQILDISHKQGCTCMYTSEELATFPQERLNSIYVEIQTLGSRGPWRKGKSVKGKGSIKRWSEFAPCRIGG